MPLYRDVLHLQYVSKLQFIRKLLGDLSGKRVLDFGCGDGRFCYELRYEGCEIVGVDYSHNALLFARAFNPKIAFFQSLDDAGDCFDWVVMVDVLEHIPPEQINEFLGIVFSKLKPGGKILISVPSVNVPLSRKHYQHFTPDSLTQTISAFGTPDCVTGHMEGGLGWKRYSRLVAWSALWHPFTLRWPVFSYWVKRLNVFIKASNHVSPNKCHTIVAIFSKRNAAV